MAKQDDSNRIKTLEARVLLLEAELEKNAKLANYGWMSANVIHEVSSPATMIMAIADRLTAKLIQGPVDKETLLQELDRVNVSSRKISKIIKNMRHLLYSQEEASYEETSLEEVFEASLCLYRDKLREMGIEFEYMAFNPDDTIQCSPGLIGQVVLNLVKNAAEAIEGSKGAWIKVTNQVCGDRVKIRITDSGKGIDPAVAKQIMEPLFTTKGEGVGTGIGLPLSKKIIQEHGGRLFLNDQSSHTEFVIDLPLCRSQTSA